MTAVNLELGSLSDDLLMLSYQDGDDRAFTLLSERWRGRLQSFFENNYRLDTDTAEDLVQDVFVQLVRHREFYDSKGRFDRWLITIAKRMAISEHRRRRVRNAVNLDSEQSLIDPKAKTDHLAELHNSREIISWVLAQLSNGQREIFILREFEDKSYREIAEVLGKTLPTVRIQLHRARANFTLLMRDKLRVSQLS